MSKEKIKMVALSWKQPFASMMLHGKIETRTRKTHVRGLVLICASKYGYSNLSLLTISSIDHVEQIEKAVGDLKQLPCGVAIAVGELYDCTPMQPEDESKCFVRYYDDLWCWHFRNVRAIEPFPYKGSQGWSNVTDDVLKKIKYLETPVTV